MMKKSKLEFCILHILRMYEDFETKENIFISHSDE